MWRFLVDVVEATEDSAPPAHVPQLEEGRVLSWEDSEPAAMAAWSRPMPHAASVNAVYTPPEQRGRGYAAAVVAAVTRGLLDGAPEISRGLGPRRHVCLYTDLDNPTANRLCARLGFEARSDWDALDLIYPRARARREADVNGARFGLAGGPRGG
jgi:predicted GNAT family acetyltransferase